jgi:hypothetical protein
VLHASLDKNPYGINPLLQRSVQKQEQAPVIATPTQKEKKLPTLNPSFKVTPRSSSQIKLRGVAPPSQGPALSESYRNQIGSASSKKSLHVLDGSPRDVVALGLDTRFTPKRSVKRLIIDDASVLLPTPTKPELVSDKKNVTFDPVLEEACANIQKNESPIKTPSSKPKHATSVSPKDSSLEYKMSPSLDELLRMSDAELKKVSNFQVSIPVFGSVTFVEPVDLLSVPGGRAGIQYIPDTIIVLESQLLTVYPDESIKPPRGLGLNVPAIVSLKGCWPKDKSTGEIVDNESDPRFDKHIRKLKKMEDTTFIGFEVITGTWKFRVEHFSRYGLVSDDDEDEDEIQPELIEEEETAEIEDTFMKEEPAVWNLVIKDQPSDEVSSEEEQLTDDYNESSENEGCYEDYDEETEQGSNYESDTGSFEDFEDEISDQSEEPLVEIEKVVDPLETSKPTLQKLETARKVQTLKTLLFSNSPAKETQVTKLNPTPVFTLSTPEKRPLEDLTNQVVSSRTKFSTFPGLNDAESPKKYIRENETEIKTNKIDLRKQVPFEQSITKGKQYLFVDAAHFLSRSFRVGWGPNDNFVKLSRYFLY